MHIYMTYTYITIIGGHTANDLMWYSVECTFCRCVFYFVPLFGLHLYTLGHEEILVLSYKATLNYQQTSFTGKVTKWRK